MTKSDLAKFKLVYREIQLLHTHSADCIKNLTPFLLTVALVFVISVLYVLIGRHSVMTVYAQGLLTGIVAPGRTMHLN